LCDDFNKDPAVGIDFDYWWKLAQKAVAKDLENPLAMADIRREALHLQELFGL
jgi:hypothetical protein